MTAKNTFKYCKFYPFVGESFEAFLYECEYCDGLEEDGRIDKVNHAAHIRRVEQRDLVVRWYSSVFPKDIKRLPLTHKQIDWWIRTIGLGSVADLLDTFNNAVLKAKNKHKPIQYPRSYLDGVTRNTVKDMEKRQLSARRRLLLEAEKDTPLVVDSTLADKPKQLPSPEDKPDASPEYLEKLKRAQEQPTPTNPWAELEIFKV